MPIDRAPEQAESQRTVEQTPSAAGPVQESPQSGFEITGELPVARAPTGWDGGSLQRQILRLQRAAGNRAVQRAVGAAGGSRGADEDIAARLDAREGQGSALDGDARQHLEQGLGADLSRVRVHTDGEADTLARAVDATAFTTGDDIYFRQGAYDPGSDQGRWLLAHEAAHTLQQAAGPVPGTPIAGGVTVSDPSDGFEKAAEHAADTVARGGQARVASGSSGVQRAAIARSRRLARQKPEEEEEAAASSPDASSASTAAGPAPTPGAEGAAGPAGEQAGPGQAPAGGAAQAGAEGGGQAGEAAVAEGAEAAGAMPGGQVDVAGAAAAAREGAQGGSGPAPSPPQEEPVNLPDVGQQKAAEQESDGENQTEQARNGDKPEPGKKNPVPVADPSAMGEAERRAKEEEGDEELVQRSLQRWAPTREIEGFIDLWPTNLQVKMKEPPNIVVGRYNSGWSPRVYFDHEYSWDTHSGPSGHFYINGQEHANWDSEDEWVDLRNVPKSSIQQPGPDDYSATPNTAAATFVTRPDFHTDERTVRAQAGFSTYRSALAARPTATMTEDAFDRTNIITFGETQAAAANHPAITINANIAQSVQTTVSQTATGAFAHTTTTAVETSAGLEGSAGGERPGSGGQGKDTFGLKASLGRKWTDTEQEQAQRSLADAYSEVSTSSQSYTIPFSIPAGVPAVCLVVPVTRKVTSNFRVLNTDDNGFVETGQGVETRVAESHVPKGYLGVYGYDVEYVRALQTHYEECRAIREVCRNLRGRPLEEKKRELRQKISDFSENQQPSVARARQNANEQLAAAAAAPGGTVAAPPPVAADNIMRWHQAIERFWTFADSPTG